MHQDFVAVPDAARRQSGGGGPDPVVERGPGPGDVAPDEGRPAGKPPRRLDRQMREVRGRNQRSGSRIET